MPCYLSPEYVTSLFKTQGRGKMSDEEKPEEPKKALLRMLFIQNLDLSRTMRQYLYLILFLIRKIIQQER